MSTSRPDEQTEATARFLRFQEAYVREMLRPPTLGERLADAWAFFRAVVWPRISHAAIGLALILLTFFVLLIGCATAAKSAEAGHWTTAEVTAYCPCDRCCGDFADGFTANMTRVSRVPYNFAADKSLPFGARIYVPSGLGVLDVVRADDRWFSVDDRGGALDTEARRYAVLRLDLRVREHDWAVRFGRRMLPVFVVRGGK